MDCHIHFICPQQIDEALYAGVTCLLGGGTGPPPAPTPPRPPRPLAPAADDRAADSFAMNIGFPARQRLPARRPRRTGPRRRLRAETARGLGHHPAHRLLPVGGRSVRRAGDDPHRHAQRERFRRGHHRRFKGRTIHASTPRRRRRHAPDIIKVAGLANVIPSSTNPTRPYTRNTIASISTC